MRPLAIPGMPRHRRTPPSYSRGHGLVARRSLPGSGTQMTLPELHREVDRSHVRSAGAPVHRWRAGSVPARPLSTRSSFHARLAASRTPAHMPCPANGGIEVRSIAGEEDATDPASVRRTRAWNV